MITYHVLDSRDQGGCMEIATFQFKLRTEESANRPLIRSNSKVWERRSSRIFTKKMCLYKRDSGEGRGNEDVFQCMWETR